MPVQRFGNVGPKAEELFASPRVQVLAIQDRVGTVVNPRSSDATAQLAQIIVTCNQ